MVQEDDKVIWEVEIKLSEPVKQDIFDVGGYLALKPKNSRADV